jgi:endoglucanase
MHKKFGKALSASLVSATMLTTATVGFIAPMSASAGNMLGQSTFDDGVGLPWHTCETNPAKQTFEIADGSYNVTIVENDGPESRWDLQLRHRGLTIQAGHTYKVHWEVNASTSGELYTKIGDYSGKVEVWHNNSTGSGDFNQTWDCVKINAGNNSFDATFTADQSVDVAEWAFHYGGKGEHQAVDCFPNGTTLKFDNLTLECLTCGDESGEGCNFDQTNEMGVVTPRSNVRLNQVGYFENLDKKASYVTSATTPLKWELRDSSGKVVKTGETEPKGYDEDSCAEGETVHIIDFSDYTTGGSDYTIFVYDTVGTPTTTVNGENIEYTNTKTGVTYTMNESHPFNIANTVYDGMLTDALNYYYQNRSGVAIESKYITSGDTTSLAHQAGHVKDEAYVQSAWVKSYSSEFDGDKSYTVNGTGGWYDAGDHGKYVVNGGISVWTLQNMYEWSVSQGTDDKFADGSGTVVVPESGNGAPDILDEARVELEWMFKMMVDSSDPYWGQYEGMVYHKLHDHKWTGLATKPWDYESEWGTTRIIKPPTYAATLNMAACAAQAARLWAGIDDDFANTCLENAKTAYNAAKKAYAANGSKYSEDDPLYAPIDEAIGGGAYGDTYVDDDFYWVACELYATTGDSTYYTDLSKYQNTDADDKAFSLTTNLSGGENNGSFTSFNWGCTAGLGTLTLYLSDKTSATDKATIETNIKKAADAYIDEQDSQGMGIPYHGTTFQDAVNIGEGIDVTGYEWGSNSFVVNNAIVMAYAYAVTGDTTYINGAAESMDYILGRNGLGFSYVSGYGDYSMSNPHHRYWCNGVDSSFPMAPSGVMSGGPGAGMQDPYIGGLGYKRGTLANQKCYVDSAEAWSVNEVTINWNAPFAWVVSFLEDAAPDVDSTTSSSTDDEIIWGDANVDGTVDIADVVAVAAYVGDSTANPLTEKGLRNADVHANGNGINASDALTIQQYLAKIVASLPV